MNSTNLAKEYQKKSAREHILDAPDTYIGSVEESETENWIFANEGEKFQFIQYNWISGLYKLFDEGIVNCRDHVIRMKTKKDADPGNRGIQPVTYIDVGISDDGIITMINDGNGIDIAKHPEHDLWIPEMIFGHLRTSTNYNKEEKKNSWREKRLWNKVGIHLVHMGANRNCGPYKRTKIYPRIC